MFIAKTEQTEGPPWKVKFFFAPNEVFPCGVVRGVFSVVKAHLGRTSKTSSLEQHSST